MGRLALSGGAALAARRSGGMPKGSLFTLGWRPIGSSNRRWQLQHCVDVAEPVRIAAALAQFDGDGRWRVYDMATVPAEGGSVKLVRRNGVAEGVVLRDVPVTRPLGAAVAVDR